MLSDKHWLKLRRILLEVGLYDKKNLRMTVEGMLYRIRVGCPWRDLPEAFGSWKAVYKRFNEWSKAGKLEKVFKHLSKDSDPEWSFMDGSFVKAHQHASGARMGFERAIGNTVGGKTSKIHMLVDACGNPVHFEITGGQVHDSKGALDLIKHMPDSDYAAADKAYGSELIREALLEKNIIPVIPDKSNAVVIHNFDPCIYNLRHLVENIFARLKHFRGIATRYDKLKRNFEAALFLACGFIWLPL